MTISNDQLLTWTNSPASTKPQYTHQQIREALAQGIGLSGKNFEVYLQGSYANSTNIKADSDVDIVVQLSSAFQYNLSKLNEVEKSLFHITYSNSTYSWINFRQDVINALVTFFGQEKIVPGNKSIKLLGDSNLLNADIVPCLQFRNYNNFSLINKKDFIEGIKFWTIRESKEIINYPKAHRSNGEDKNAQHRTNERYKDVVRIVKNIKKRLVENNNLDPKIAPSYFIECAVYNVPDGHFTGNHQNSLGYVLNHLLRQCNPSILLTVSHQHSLFGLESWQWNTADASNFFTAVENYYLNN